MNYRYHPLVRGKDIWKASLTKSALIKKALEIEAPGSIAYGSGLLPRYQYSAWIQTFVTPIKVVWKVISIRQQLSHS